MIIKEECKNMDLPGQDYTGVEYLYYLGTPDIGLYGIIRYEVVPTLVLVHPRLFVVSKTTLNLMKKDVFEVGAKVFEKYNFKEFYFTSHNAKFIRLLFGDNFTEIENIAGTPPLYRHSLG